MALTPQSNATLEFIADVMRKAKTFAIAGHVSPDGDCIGSQLALGCVLECLGKRVTYLMAEDVPVDETLAFLPGAEKLIPGSSELEPVDVFVGVDVPSLERMGSCARHHHAARCTVTIDHHANDERISDFAYVDPDAASTTMIIWRLAGLLCGVVPRDAAECCYMGLMTDTGGFRFQNADHRAFAAAAQMVSMGANPSKCAQEAYQNRTIESLKLMSLAMERAELVNDGQGVISWVSEDDMAEIGAKRSDAEPLIDVLRSIRGVRIACMLRGQDGVVRGSMRAKDDSDVAQIARMHGGGGHKAAAGFTMQVPIEDAFETIKAEIEAALK